MTHPAHRPDLPALLEDLRDVEGWMSDDQAARLWEAAEAVRPPGTIVEIGSYHGRSAIVLATAAAVGVAVVAIDPHAGNDRGPRELEGDPADGEADHQAFLANLARHGVADRVRHVRFRSADALPLVDGPIDVLYVDGAHDYRSARDDLRDWAARVVPGGRVLVHDAYSSVGVTLALLRLTVWSPRLRYVGRARSLVEFRVAPLPLRTRPANAWRQLRELPWFARNVLVKVAIVAGRPELARRLGHHEGPWPF